MLSTSWCWRSTDISLPPPEPCLSHRAISGWIVSHADHCAGEHRLRRPPGARHRQPTRRRTPRCAQARAVGACQHRRESRQPRRLRPDAHRLWRARSCRISPRRLATSPSTTRCAATCSSFHCTVGRGGAASSGARVCTSARSSPIQAAGSWGRRVHLPEPDCHRLMCACDGRRSALTSTKASGRFQVDPIINLHQVSYHGPVVDAASFTDANAQAMLGAVLQTISSPTPAPTSPAGILLTTLQTLNMAVVDSHGGIGISADAFNAITADAAGYLGSQLNSALNSGAGFAGFTATSVVIPEPRRDRYAGVDAPARLAAARNLPAAKSVDYRPAHPIDGWQQRLVDNRRGHNHHARCQRLGPILHAETRCEPATWARFRWRGRAPTANSRRARSHGFRRSHCCRRPAHRRCRLRSAMPSRVCSSRGLHRPCSKPLPDPASRSDPSTPSSPQCRRCSPRQQHWATAAAGSTRQDHAILQFIGNLAGLPAGPGLTLPGNLQLTASGAGTDADPAKIQLATTASIGGVLDLAGGVSFDKLIHPSPTGS